MKSSDYNYFTPYKGKHIFFNGITHRFFLASKRNHAKLKDIISRPDAYKEKFAVEDGIPVCQAPPAFTGQ